MDMFLNDPNLLIDEYNEMSAIAQRKSFITVGIEIQKEEINTLKQYREDLKEFKKELVQRNLESYANLVYCLETSLLSIQHELEMLVNIKEDKMGDAWENLVNAQVAFGNVLRNAPSEIQPPHNYLRRLSAYEKLLFPKLYFQSVGGIIKQSHCSICNESFEKCDHIKGKLYNGEVCCRVITEMELEEVSFVDNPANKHCRILSIQFDGKNVDVMTLREQNT